MLTPEIRDELLIRLDERVKELKYEDVPEIKERLDRMNGCVRGADTRSKVNRAILTVLLGGGGIFGIVSTVLNLW